jgi:hypothetical protein
MRCIVDGEGVRIAEDGECLLEADAVLAEIRFSLRLVPFELEIHPPSQITICRVA